jgi:exodeoxyribonuclease VII large subunit
VPERPPRPGESLSFDFDAPAPVPPPAPAPAPAPPPEPRVFSVAQLGQIVSRSLERFFVDAVWVEGEVTGARPAPSGHVYFCLKDEMEDAVIDVVLYRSQVTPRARTLVKDGARIRVRGRPTYWAPRGRLQFVGDRVEETGKGALLEALARLKEKLQAEGLFDPERKRPLPHDPRVIGVVTSAGGAVIHDICKVAFRRGGARILLASAQVQGANAVPSIRHALRSLQRIAAVDVIVIGRGGGSSDDLVAFNDEALVRDVAACRVPVVSAVGHEVDVTLVDFAADARAATPSQAAEMIVPDEQARRRLLEERTERLRRAMTAHLSAGRLAIGKLAFRDPRLLIAAAQQRIDENVARLDRALSQRMARDREGYTRLEARLASSHPRVRIGRDRVRIEDLSRRLFANGPRLVDDRRERLTAARLRLEAIGPKLAADRHERLVAATHRLEAVGPRLIAARRERFESLVSHLDAMSPLRVLARGYAIVTREGHAVRDASEVAPGEAVHVRVATGEFDARVIVEDES